MSQYGTEYRLEWITSEVVDDTGSRIPSQTVRVSIFDTENLIDDADTPVIIPLKPSGNPLSVSTINNDRDKFQTIRSLQAVIEFLSDKSQFQDVTTFSDSADNRWRVEIFSNPATDNDPIFYGFLILVDSQQNFQPDPNIVVLTATDHIASLKGIPWTTDAGLNPVGKYKIGVALALCFKKTGLNLGIKVINNLRHGSGQLINDAVFSSSGDYIVTTGLSTTFFYVGMEFTVSGSASNNGVYIVTSVVQNVVTEVHVNVNITVGESTANVVFTDNSSGHMYDRIYIDAKSAESQVGNSINCHDLIEKILGEYCFLTQWLGFWYIVAIDEYDTHDFFTATFDADGVFVSIDAGTTIEQLVGRGEDIKLALADCIMSSDSKHRQIVNKFSFELPEEIPDNQNFGRGTLITDSGTTKTFTLDDWARVIVDNNTGAEASSTDFDAYITKEYNEFGDIIEQYAVLEYGTFVTGSRHWVKSNPIPMMASDKFDFTIDWRLNSSEAGSTEKSFFLTMFVLNGNDGSKWIYTNPQPGPLPASFFVLQWVPYATAIFYHSIYYNYVPDDTDVTKPITVSQEVKALPVDGDLVVYLANYNEVVISGIFERDVYYSSLRIDYKPYIGGSYQTYTGFENSITRATPSGYFTKRERQTYLNDSPKPLFKWAMFFLSGSAYVLTSRWYTASTFDLLYPDSTIYLHPYGYTQAYAVWNQYVNANRVFDGTAYGLGVDFPWLIARYLLTDNDTNTNNRYFLLISFEQNWKTGLWSAVFIEVFRTDIGKVYSDTHLFKYLTK